VSQGQRMDQLISQCCQRIVCINISQGTCVTHPHRAPHNNKIHPLSTKPRDDSSLHSVGRTLSDFPWLAGESEVIVSSFRPPNFSSSLKPASQKLALSARVGAGPAKDLSVSHCNSDLPNSPAKEVLGHMYPITRWAEWCEWLYICTDRNV